jgi:hypothetical protein
VVVHNLDIVSIAISPDEAQPPLIVNADAVLSLPIVIQRLQTIAWRFSEIVEPRCGG